MKAAELLQKQAAFKQHLRLCSKLNSIAGLVNISALIVMLSSLGMLSAPAPVLIAICCGLMTVGGLVAWLTQTKAKWWDILCTIPNQIPDNRME